MLKPRRANMLEMRIERARLVLDEDGERVDHGTGTDLRSLVLDEVERGRAGRDHREAVLGRIDAAVDDRRAAAGERLGERRLELVLVVDA